MSNDSPIIRISDVSKYFDDVAALSHVSLDVAPGEKVVIIGPSGSGKSTLLRTINRLEDITSGKIVVDGFDLDDKSVDINKVRMEVGMVFQSFNLFPHKTVLENITLAPIKLKGMAKADADAMASRLLEKVGILEKADVFPAKLSGGQQQRVAIARAL
ncbi:MAG: ABC-type polar amino acid transport system, ATPase component, partial [Solidesulfovibrio magneticus str. Maddingley MBC34]